MAISSTSKPSDLRVFISHSSKDSQFSVKLVQDLRNILNGDNTVWHDASGSLHGGDEWWRIIVEEITTRQVFIVVLSPDAMASPWVNDEINLAWKQKNSKPGGKLILPIMYRKCAVREDLDTLNIISFLPPKSYEAAFNELLIALSTMTEKPLPPFISPSHLITRRTAVIGLAGLTILTVAGGSAFELWKFLQKHSLSPLSVTSPAFYSYSGFTDKVTCVAWSPDGKRIASAGDDKTVQIWSAPQGKPVSYKVLGAHPVRGLVWSLDNTRIALINYFDSQVQIWNALTGAVMLTYQGHGAPVLATVWSPDSKYIASGSQDGTVHIWDARTGEMLVVYRGHVSEVWSVAWAPNKKYLASGSRDKTIQVWSPAGKSISTYLNHFDAVTTLEWFPDSKRISSGSWDQTVQIWDALKARAIFIYHAHSEVIALAQSPDGA